MPLVSQAMVQETTRAVKELGMAGVALFVGPTAKPPDMACFEGLYRTCEELGAAVWVHPCRPQSYADYDAYKVGACFLARRVKMLFGCSLSFSCWVGATVCQAVVCMKTVFAVVPRFLSFNRGRAASTRSGTHSAGFTTRQWQWCTLLLRGCSGDTQVR